MFYPLLLKKLDINMSGDLMQLLHELL